VKRHANEFHLVPSIVTPTHRCRVIYDQVWFRPPNETLPEFLIAVTWDTMGKQWLNVQNGMPPGQRHVVRQWWDSWGAFTRRTTQIETPTGPRGQGLPSGQAKALLSLGWDLYCLQSKNRLPEEIVERLRRNAQFQSAQYEVTTAAIMLRAGFSIEWVKRTEPGKHCEFLASHPSLGGPLAVEAKSRCRPGVYHEAGEFDYVGLDDDSLLRLVKRGSKQGPAGCPLVIFVDVNAPASISGGSDWVVDIQRVFGRLQGSASRKESSKWSVVLATNFPFHFGKDDQLAPPIEAGMVWSRYSPFPCPENLRHAILAETMSHGRIPQEV
jgi:hypothetical protein